MTELTDEAVEALLDGATPGPWRADGPPYNRIVWSSNENRVCFMAHTNGLDDARDNATSNLVAAAPDLARALLATRAELAQARADAQADARREGGSPLTDETPAQHEERTCTCGAGHGSLEGHMDWCDFTAYQSLNALAEVQARDDAPTPPDTWHERRSMLPDGDARKEGGK